MTVDKVWCKNCYIKLSKTFDKKYGKGNWSFANLGAEATFNSKQYEYIFYPPFLIIELLLRKKNGEYSKSKRKEKPYFPNFCPFCGKKIIPESLEK